MSEVLIMTCSIRLQIFLSHCTPQLKVSGHSGYGTHGHLQTPSSVPEERLEETRSYCRLVMFLDYSASLQQLAIVSVR